MDTNTITLPCSLVCAGNYPKNKAIRVMEGLLSTVLTLLIITKIGKGPF